MRFSEFRDAVQRELAGRPAGLTWLELRRNAALPYDRPCPEWTRRLEQEIGLVRVRGERRALRWTIRRAD